MTDERRVEERRKDEAHDAAYLALSHMYLCGAALATEALLWIARRLQPMREEVSTDAARRKQRVHDALQFTSGIIMPGHEEGSLSHEEVSSLRMFVAEVSFGLETIGMSPTANAPERFKSALAQFELLSADPVPSEEQIVELGSFFSVVREYCLKKHERASQAVTLV